MEDALWEKRQQLLETTRTNTRLLTETCDLKHDKKLLDKSLNEALRPPEDLSRSRKHDEHEQKQLVQLVRMQATEIESLRAEITKLMRKDGHIAPPPAKPSDRLPPVRSS